jgi:protein O-mannosyl-transferase
MRTQRPQSRGVPDARGSGDARSSGMDAAAGTAPTSGLPWSLAGILVTTFLVYLPSLGNRLTNWDDDQYVLNNPLVHRFSLQALASLFSPTTQILGNYHPLTILSYALEWHFAGANPLLYHVTNLLLHLVSTILVYRVVLALTSGNARSALVTAALFALHPMHVESVAWISERKDVLYTAFFLGSLLMYLRYSATGRLRDLGGSLLMFLLSLLSKGQAVVLPAVILLVDAYQRRPFTLRKLLEKWPYFLLALGFGVVAVLAQKTGGNIGNAGLPLWQSPFFGSWGFVLYLVRFVVPAPLSALHPYPVGQDGALPPWVLGGPLVALAIAILVFRARTTRRDLYYGVLFFALTILPVLQFLPVGRAFVAERYTYLPYIGLSWVVGQTWAGASAAGSRSRARVLRALVLAVIACFALMSTFRTRVWKDGMTLWQDVLAKYPDCAVALFNRSSLCMDEGRFDLAAADGKRLVELRPRDVIAWSQYGGALALCRRFREAVAVLDRGIALDSTSHRLFVNRGAAYAGLGADSAALRDYARGLQLEPTDTGGRLGRGNLYMKLQRFDLAAADYAEVVAREPGNSLAGCNLGAALYRGGRLAEALRQMDRAAETWPQLERVYLIRSLVREAMGDSVQARSDLATAQTLHVAGS